MKYALLTILFGLAACDTTAFQQEEVSKQTVVMGRTWTVTQVGEAPLRYSAIRDNNNFDPFGRPAARRTPQAVRAIQQATGCRVSGKDFVQDATGRYFANVVCS